MDFTSLIYPGLHLLHLAMSSHLTCVMVHIMLHILWRMWYYMSYGMICILPRCIMSHVILCIMLCINIVGICFQFNVIMVNKQENKVTIKHSQSLCKVLKSLLFIVRSKTIGQVTICLYQQLAMPLSIVCLN